MTLITHKEGCCQKAYFSVSFDCRECEWTLGFAPLERKFAICTHIIVSLLKA